MRTAKDQLISADDPELQKTLNPDPEFSTPTNACQLPRGSRSYADCVSNSSQFGISVWQTQKLYFYPSKYRTLGYHFVRALWLLLQTHQKCPCSDSPARL
jgi:hypothetical protein